MQIILTCINKYKVAVAYVILRVQHASYKSCTVYVTPKSYLPQIHQSIQISDSRLEESNNFSFSVINRSIAGYSSRQPSRDSCRLLSCRRKEEKGVSYLQILPPDINCCKG